MASANVLRVLSEAGNSGPYLKVRVSQSDESGLNLLYFRTIVYEHQVLACKICQTKNSAHVSVG